MWFIYLKIAVSPNRQIQRIEEQLLNLPTAINESWSRINVYQEILQPLEDDLNGSRKQLQKIAKFLEDIFKSPRIQTTAVSDIMKYRY